MNFNMLVSIVQCLTANSESSGENRKLGQLTGSCANYESVSESLQRKSVRHVVIRHMFLPVRQKNI